MSILKVERKLLKMLSQPHCSSRRLSLFWVALLLKGQKELFSALKVVEKNLWTLSGVDENAKDLPILYEKGFLKGKILQRLRIVERKHYCTTEVVTSVKSRAKFNLIERRFQVTYFCGNLSSRERSELIETFIFRFFNLRVEYQPFGNFALKKKCAFLFHETDRQRDFLIDSSVFNSSLQICQFVRKP